MFDPDRSHLRAFYTRVWEKMAAAMPLEPLERIVGDTIEQHPQYQEIVADPGAVHEEFSGSNPYLHMGMHIAIHEQLQADRPHGMRRLYRRIMAHYADAHTGEHAIMSCLQQVMLEVGGVAGAGLDKETEARYLAGLRLLARGKRGR